MLNRLTGLLMMFLIATPMCCCGVLGQMQTCDNGAEVPVCCHKKPQQEEDHSPGSDECPCKSRDSRSIESTDSKPVFIQANFASPVVVGSARTELPYLSISKIRFLFDYSVPPPVAHRFWQEYCVYLL